MAPPRKHEYFQGVYLITNLENGKKYVGESYHVMQRMTNHRNALLQNRHNVLAMQADFNTDRNIDKFKIELLENCSKSGNNRGEVERRYIAEFESWKAEKGYNRKHGPNVWHHTHEKRALAEAEIVERSGKTGT